MKPLSCLGFCDARGDDSVGNWQGWIFNEEQTATLEQWAGQRAPISSANSSCRLIHQTRGELSLHSALQGLHQSPVSCYFCPSCLYCQSASPSDFSSLSPSPLLSLLVFFSGELSIVDKEETNQEGACDIFIHHQRCTPKKDLFGTQRGQNHPCVHVKSLTLYPL